MLSQQPGPHSVTARITLTGNHWFPCLSPSLDRAFLEGRAHDWIRPVSPAPRVWYSGGAPGAPTARVDGWLPLLLTGCLSVGPSTADPEQGPAWTSVTGRRGEHHRLGEEKLAPKKLCFQAVYHGGRRHLNPTRKPWESAPEG